MKHLAIKVSEAPKEIIKLFEIGKIKYNNDLWLHTIKGIDVIIITYENNCITMLDSCFIINNKLYSYYLGLDDDFRKLKKWLRYH